MRKQCLLLSVVLLTCAWSSMAEVIRYDFTGVVTAPTSPIGYTDDPAYVLPVIGEPFSGYFTLDTEAMPWNYAGAEPITATQGGYAMSSSQFSLKYRDYDMHWTTDFSEIYVTNDATVPSQSANGVETLGGPEYDGFIHQYGIPDPQRWYWPMDGPWALQGFGFDFYGSSPSPDPLSSVGIPTNLDQVFGQFEIRSFTFMMIASPNPSEPYFVLLYGEITSLVPEPASVVMLAAGGLWLLRRRG